jgi:AraC-like DNA-binding protein
MDPEARIPADVYHRFWPRAAEFTGDPCFGLHLGERLRPLANNIAVYLLMSSTTVREGIERATAYQRLVFDEDWHTLVDQGSSARLHLDYENRHPLEMAVEIEYRAMILVKFLDWITAIDFRASEVRFRHPPAGERSEYERIFGCAVKFACKESELLLSRSSLDQPSLHANPEIARLHQAYAECHLAKLEDRSVTRRVKEILMAQLERGPFHLSDVARSLYMSPRTLQRRLAQEGITYHGVLDSLRRDLCLQHLERPDTAMAEIAYVAGFSDTSAFSRAVRRWTGQTPLEYRRTHRETTRTGQNSRMPGLV